MTDITYFPAIHPHKQRSLRVIMHPYREEDLEAAVAICLGGGGKISRDPWLTAAPPQHAKRQPNEIFLPPQRIYHNARRGCTIEIRDVAYITQHKQIPFDRASYNATMQFTSYVLKFKFYYGRFDGFYEAKSNANKRFVKIVTFTQYTVLLLTLL